MKMKLLAVICLSILTMNLMVPVFATEENNVSDTKLPAFNGAVIISDPETGEKWDWELQSSDISVSQLSRASNGNDTIKDAEVNVNVGEYLLRTMTNPVDGEKTIHDDITITVGLRYSVDLEKYSVSIYKAYGSAPDSGMFYATDKKFYYSNYMVFGTIKQTPTTSSWSYTTDSTPGMYIEMYCPHVLLDCRITVRGMESSYRDVSVVFKLDYI